MRCLFHNVIVVHLCPYSMVYSVLHWAC